jgi:tight adherence protein C
MSLELILILAVGMSATVGVAVVALGYAFAPSYDDSWKDPMPGGFRMAVTMMTPMLPLFELNEVRRRNVLETLTHAGLSYAIRPEEFVASCWLGAFVSLMAALIVIPVLGLGAANTALGAIGAVALGYKYPNIAVRDRIKQRQHRIQKDFPFFLDLILLCLRVGLTFTAAMEQAVTKMREGPLKEEVERTMRDIRTGVPRRQAMSQTAERIGLSSFMNFVGAINQAEESGAPLTETLSAQAEQRLDERFQKAEDQANKAPVKLMLPLTLFLLPVTMIIVFFPIVVKFLHSGASSFFG